MRNKKTSSRFWLISAALHGVVLVVLILTPAGQRVFKQEDRPLKPEIIRKDEALAEVIDDIRDLAVARLRAQVALLEAGRDRMAVNFETMNRHYEPFVAGQIASASARLTQEGEKTLGRQEEILLAARRAVELKEAGSDPMWRVFDKHRAALIAGQEEIRRVLLLTAADDAELPALQNQAEAVQMEAFEALSRSVAAQNQLWSAATRLGALGEEKAKLEVELAAAEATGRELQIEVELLKADEEEALAKQQEAQQAVVQARREVDKARREKIGEAEAREILKAREEAVPVAQQAARTSRDQRGQAERKLRSALGLAENRRKALVKIAEDTERLTATLAPATRTRDENAAKTVVLQEQALTAQRTVHEKLLSRLKRQAEDALKAEAAAKEVSS